MDKQTVRFEALKLALSRPNGVVQKPEDYVNIAKVFEEYIGSPNSRAKSNTRGNSNLSIDK